MCFETITMANRLFLFTSLLCLVNFGNTVPPTISFIPQSPLQLMYNETQTGVNLAITCLHLTGTAIIIMDLSKISDSGKMKRLMYAANAFGPDSGTGGAAVLDAGVTKAKSTGKITGADRYITLTYFAASCDSAGKYICNSGVVQNSVLVKENMQGVLVVNISPGKAAISVDSVTGPSGPGAWYMVGDVVTFTCTVNVGTVDSTTSHEILFFWQYEVDDNGTKVWEDYPNQQDIDNTRTTVPSVGQNCSTFNRISILTRQLTIEDLKRPYKCYISKGGNTYEDLAGYNAATKGKESENEASGAEGSGTNMYNITVPLAVGGVLIFGTMVTIVIVRRARARNAEEVGYHRRPSMVYTTPVYYARDNTPSDTTSATSDDHCSLTEIQQSGLTMDDTHTDYSEFTKLQV